MQLQWLAFLLCIGGLSAAQASMLESFLSMYPNSDVLAEQPSCANQIADLMLSMDYMFRQNRLKTPVKPEVIAFLTHFIYAGLISMAAVACYGWHKAASQRDAVEKQAAAREADLLKRCQGIKDQAFVLAEKLHLQSPAAGDHQHASTPGTMGDLQLQSPPAARHHMMMTPTKVCCCQTLHNLLATCYPTGATNRLGRSCFGCMPPPPRCLLQEECN